MARSNRTSKKQSRPGLRLGRQGRLAIPAPLRSQLGLKPGDELTASVEGGALILRSKRSAAAQLLGMWGDARKTRRSMVDDLLRERREEARRESSGAGR